MKEQTRSLVYGAAAVALAFALSFIKLFSMPMGGSVTLCSMLPIMAYAYRFGLKKGLLAGFAYALLQMIQSLYVVHWAQLILDYPLAFTVLGLAGLFSPWAKSESPALRTLSLPLGVLAAGLARLACHVLSGAIFFADATNPMNAWLYSLLYNGGYLGVELLMCLVVSFVPPVQKAIMKL